jgi:hypothetical protein
MIKLKAYLNDVDITDLCQFSDDSGIKVSLIPPDILDSGNMEPVTVYGFRRTENGHCDSVQYRMPRWVIEFVTCIYPGSFPDYKKPQTSKS